MARKRQHMLKLSNKLERTVNRCLPNSRQNFTFEEGIGSEIDLLEQVEQKKALRYLEESIDKTTPINSKNSEKWDNGWLENLRSYRETKNFDLLAPRYSGKLDYIRLERKLYKVEKRKKESETHKTLEHRLFSNLYDGVITRWIEAELEDVDKNITIVEVGAGSCQHIPRLYYRLLKRGIKAEFVVCDWSTTTKEIAEAISEIEGITVQYKQIDLHGTIEEVDIPKNSFVYTINALEQAGKKGGGVLKWIMKYNPKLVMHFEPLIELLEETDEIDKKSIEYIKKRGYLEGMIGTLKTEESNGRIKIERCLRTFIGNAHHENNSFACWREIV